MKNYRNDLVIFTRFQSVITYDMKYQIEYRKCKTQKEFMQFISELQEQSKNQVYICVYKFVGRPRRLVKIAWITEGFLYTL